MPTDVESEAGTSCGTAGEGDGPERSGVHGTNLLVLRARVPSQGKIASWTMQAPRGRGSQGPKWSTRRPCKLGSQAG